SGTEINRAVDQNDRIRRIARAVNGCLGQSHTCAAVRNESVVTCRHVNVPVRSNHRRASERVRFCRGPDLRTLARYRAQRTLRPAVLEYESVRSDDRLAASTGDAPLTHTA